MILQNVPGKKMAKRFGGVYLYIQTLEVTFVFVGHDHVEFQKSA
jgi:hypothetical protein